MRDSPSYKFRGWNSIAFHYFCSRPNRGNSLQVCHMASAWRRTRAICCLAWIRATVPWLCSLTLCVCARLDTTAHCANTTLTTVTPTLANKGRPAQTGWTAIRVTAHPDGLVSCSQCCFLFSQLYKHDKHVSLCISSPAMLAGNIGAAWPSCTCYNSINNA